MSKKLVADLIVDYLERRDVEYVFGLCGHTVIGMLDALSRSKKLKFVNTRHEAIASTAADGYAPRCPQGICGHVPPGPRHHKCPHWCGQRLPGLYPHGRHCR